MNGAETKINDSPVVYNYLDFHSLEPAPIVKETTLYIVSLENKYRISAVDSQIRRLFTSEPLSRATKIYIIKDHDDFFHTLKRLGKIEIVFPIDEEYHTNLLTNNTFNLEEIQTYCKNFDPQKLTDEFGLTRDAEVVQIAPLSIESTPNLTYTGRFFEPSETTHDRQNEQFHLWNEESSIRARLFCLYCCLIPFSCCTGTIAALIQNEFSFSINNTLVTLDNGDEETPQIQSPIQH